MSNTILTNEILRTKPCRTSSSQQNFRNQTNYPVAERGTVKKKPQKMAAPHQKAQCVSCVIETKSDMQNQWNYRMKYGRDPLLCPSIHSWHKKFMEKGILLGKGRNGWPRTSAENISHVRQVFLWSPTKSIHTAARQWQMLRSTVQKVLHKNLQLYAYKVQLLQAFEPNDKPKQKEFAVNMLEWISEDETFLTWVCFSDEATFHVSGKLNTYNVRIWGSEQSHVTRELCQDSPKVKAKYHWCHCLHWWC